MRQKGYRWVAHISPSYVSDDILAVAVVRSSGMSVFGDEVSMLNTAFA